MSRKRVDIQKNSLVEVRDLIRAKEVSVREVAQSCLAQIDHTEPRIRAILHIDKDRFLQQADDMDNAGPSDDKPLFGVPISVKDLFTTKGMPTTCASRILEGFVPPYDATVVRKLKDAGALIIAKTNMDEFAMGSSNENSGYFPTRNPWDTSRVPGGSSGGAAAGVSAMQCFCGVGTDTGGSIRLPASYCGCVGLKPTYGRVSRYGMVAYGSSLDQAGALTRTVRDNATVLQVIAGFDERDSTSIDTPVPDYEAALSSEPDLSGLRIGMPREYWGGGLEPEIDQACRDAVRKAEELGARIVEVSLPHLEYAVATYYIIAMAEASANLARFDGVRYGHRDKTRSELVDMYRASRTQGFGDEVQRRIIIGTYVLSSGYYDAYYRKAAQVRRLIRDDFLQAFESCDVIAGPTCPMPPFPIGEKIEDPLQMYLLDIFTISLNLAGLPGMSLPVGLGKDTSLPVGLQLFGPAFGEEVLLRTASALELAMDPLPVPSGIAD